LFLGRSHFGAVASVVGNDERGLEVSGTALRVSFPNPAFLFYQSW
jgi:hypothetical protein